MVSQLEILEFVPKSLSAQSLPFAKKIIQNFYEFPHFFLAPVTANNAAAKT